MSYTLATNELTLTDIKQFRGQAVEAGINRALGAGIARTREELVVRDALPFTDFGAGAVGWTLTDSYRGPVIAAAGWGSPFNAGALPVNAPTLAVNKVAVFFKFADYTPIPLVAGERYRVGGTGASTRAAFQTQLVTGAKIEPDHYYSEPVVYDPQDVVYLELMYTGAVVAGAEMFAYGAFIIERVGATIS